MRIARAYRETTAALLLSLTAVGGAQAQSTELDLVYGRVRATATRIVAPNGEFKVRTKAAVAGVVGTEEYVEASDANTIVRPSGLNRGCASNAGPSLMRVALPPVIGSV